MDEEQSVPEQTNGTSNGKVCPKIEIKSKSFKTCRESSPLLMGEMIGKNAYYRAL